MRVSNILIVGAILLFAFSGTASAEMNHSFIDGPFETGPEVTAKCIICHPDAATEMLDSAHWNWAGSSPDAVGHETDTNLGKADLVNNFCIAIGSNEPRCTTCHVGYGWADDTFDFTEKTNIDCLVCHDTTGTYKKDPPLKDADGNFIFWAGFPNPEADLEAVAQSVGAPTRDTCGSNCHFYGGGGDNVKHGDLYSTLAEPTSDMDVHMGVDGLDFSCQECHTTTEHKIAGGSVAIPVREGRVTCTDSGCHDATPHAGENAEDLNAHTETVACQTCHIPTFANELPTKMSWDWSTAGQDIEVVMDVFGKPTYSKLKGDFVWDMNVVPTYAWYNGKVERYVLGDKINTEGVTTLDDPVGNIDDADSMIYPFKVHSGKQISDAVNNYIIVPDLFAGADSYWKAWDWDRASASGMAAVGLEYSGEYEFVETEMYLGISHEVAPKENALACDDCHAEGGRIDFAALGYSGDPMDVGGRFGVVEEEAGVEYIPEEQLASIPGFEAVLAVAGLLGAILLARRD